MFFLEETRSLKDQNSHTCKGSMEHLNTLHWLIPLWTSDFHLSRMLAMLPVSKHRSHDKGMQVKEKV